MIVKSSRKTCFVIGPIGEEGSPIREDADRLVRLVLSDPLSRADFDHERADKIAVPGHITGKGVRFTY